MELIFGTRGAVPIPFPMTLRVTSAPTHMDGPVFRTGITAKLFPGKAAE